MTLKINNKIYALYLLSCQNTTLLDILLFELLLKEYRITQLHCAVTQDCPAVILTVSTTNALPNDVSTSKRRLFCF